MGLAAVSVPCNEPNTKPNVTQPMHAQLFLVLTQANQPNTITAQTMLLPHATSQPQHKIIRASIAEKLM